MEGEKIYCLQGMNDFIGDAIDNDEVSAYQISDSIKRELRDLADYHEESARKCRATLELLNGYKQTSQDHIRSFFPSAQSNSYLDGVSDILNFNASYPGSSPDTITL